MTGLERTRNIGISAHIDSGKTTLTERILFYTGKIHAIHEVRGKDGVGATMDAMELEREKGITIQSAATSCVWKEYDVNIIDTPGHVDFTIEVERALRVLDGAVLVLCSVAGVQSQSMTVNRQMNRYNVPRIAFVNKMDRAGANAARVTAQLREKLALNAQMIAIPIGDGDRFEGIVDVVEMRAIYNRGEQGETIEYAQVPESLHGAAEAARDALVAALADLDDNIAEAYLDGEAIENATLKSAIRRLTVSRQFVPVLMGSAYRNKGVQTLLDAVGDYLPAPFEVPHVAIDAETEEEVSLSSDPSASLVALAFKLEDGRYGQLSYTRVYQGTLQKGMAIYNSRTNRKVKVGRLVRMHSDEMEEIDSAPAGEIVALFGIECASGDTFTDGDRRLSMSSIHVPDTVIELAVTPTRRNDQTKFSRALNRFSKEDPTFRVRVDSESGETIIAGMGELHLAVYVERIRREYGVDVEVGEPQVAYREAITQEIECDYTHKKQTGGSGQFARIMARMVPIADGEEDYRFSNEVVGGTIPKEYINSCDKGFRQQLAVGGLIGKPVVGVEMAVFDGKHHPVDSSDMAFQICAQTLIREFYKKARPVIMEPLMTLEVACPGEFQGSVVGLINQRRGMIQNSAMEGDFATITATVPLATMFGYATDLRSGTQGKGEFTMEFNRYAQAPQSVQEELIKLFREKAPKVRAA